MFDQLLKSFEAIVLSTPVWVRIIVVFIGLIAILYFVFKSSGLANKFLPATLHLGFMDIELVPVDKDEFNTGYHKLQYVKVLSLRDRTTAVPVYTRVVARLAPAERNVLVFDEAVFYTLERFAKKIVLGTRTNRSGGVVDARRIIPWKDKFVSPDRGAELAPNYINFENIPETDTFLTVGHHLNGLQGTQQEFCTRVYEDTNDARLIVDLSSIPNIDKIVVEVTAQINRKLNEAVQMTDAQQLSPGVYTLLCTDARASDQLQINITFNRSA